MKITGGGPADRTLGNVAARCVPITYVNPLFEKKSKIFSKNSGKIGIVYN